MFFQILLSLFIFFFPTRKNVESQAHRAQQRPIRIISLETQARRTRPIRIISNQTVYSVAQLYVPQLNLPQLGDYNKLANPNIADAVLQPVPENSVDAISMTPVAGYYFQCKNDVIKCYYNMENIVENCRRNRNNCLLCPVCRNPLDDTLYKTE